MDSEEKYWRDEVIKARRTQLTTVRTAAAGWSALFAAALGVFGTVAFAGGLTAGDDLDARYEVPVRTATILAAVLALATTVLAARAAGMSARRSDSESWTDLRNSTYGKADSALGLLRWAKACGAAAATLVFLGSVFVLAAGPAAQSSTSQNVVVVIAGTAYCGPMNAGEDGRLAVAGHVLENVDQVVAVPTCP